MVLKYHTLRLGRERKLPGACQDLEKVWAKFEFLSIIIIIIILNNRDCVRSGKAKRLDYTSNILWFRKLNEIIPGEMIRPEMAPQEEHKFQLRSTFH